MATLLHPFLQEDALTATQLNQISTYIDLLLRWNARINLTAIRTPEEIVTRHFGESLFTARHLCGADTPVRHPNDLDPSSPQRTTTATPQSTGRVPQVRVRSLDANLGANTPSVDGTIPAAVHERLIDVGSGAGFPGIPIKIWSPQTPVTLIESNHKKVAFLRETIRALTLTSIDVFSGRAEDYPAASATLVTLRAVERFDSILPIATRILAPQGRLALLIGHSQIARAQALAPSLHWSDPFPIPQSNTRALLLGQRQDSK